MTVDILGVAFKADTDDMQWSISCKLGRILRFWSRDVLCIDPYDDDDRLVDLDTVMDRSVLFIMGASHSDYRDLDPNELVADIWGRFERDRRV